MFICFGTQAITSILRTSSGYSFLRAVSPHFLNYIFSLFSLDKNEKKGGLSKTIESRKVPGRSRKVSRKGGYFWQ